MIVPKDTCGAQVKRNITSPTPSASARQDYKKRLQMRPASSSSSHDLTCNCWRCHPTITNGCDHGPGASSVVSGAALAIYCTPPENARDSHVLLDSAIQAELHRDLMASLHATTHSPVSRRVAVAVGVSARRPTKQLRLCSSAEGCCNLEAFFLEPRIQTNLPPKTLNAQSRMPFMPEP